MLPTITELEQIEQLRTYTPVDESSDRSRVECRICLEDSTTSDGLFIAPCKCKGSVKHVHFQCISDWILKSNKNELESNQSAIGKICCEMCKKDIYYSMQRRPVFRQFHEIKESICTDLKRCILSMFILTFLIASMIVGCFYAGILLKGGINGEQLFEGVVILVAIIFVCSFVCLTLYFVFQLYLMKTKTVITKIGRLKEEGSSLKKRQSVESLDNMQEQNTIFYLE